MYVYAYICMYVCMYVCIRLLGVCGAKLKSYSDSVSHAKNFKKQAHSNLVLAQSVNSSLQEKYTSILTQLSRLQGDCREAYKREEQSKAQVARVQLECKKLIDVKGMYVYVCMYVMCVYKY